MATAPAASAAKTTAVKSANQQRGPRGKKPSPLINEQVDLIAKISSLSIKGQKDLELTPKQIGTLTGRKPKTLETDRRQQREVIEAMKKDKTKKMDLLHPMSLVYLPATGKEREVRYTAYDLHRYLARRFKSANRSFLKRGGSPMDPELRGFQSWLSYADAADTWPFCIQADGRPLDMCEAIATGRLTEDSMRLNIHEFSDQIANAVSKSYSKEEAPKIAKAAKKGRAKKVVRTSRWDTPGGPL